MEEVASSGGLFGVQLRYEPHVHNGLGICTSHSSSVGASCPIESLPCAERRTHRRSYQQIGFLLPQQGSGAFTLSSDAKIPRFAVCRVDRSQIECIPWEKVL